MKKKIIFILLAVLLALSVGIIGCTAPAQQEEEEEEEPVEEWEIPFITVMTGPFAFFGLNAKWSVEYAADQINAAGGILGKQVKITSYDTAMDPSQAVIVMTEVIDTEPIYIIGPMDPASTGSSINLAVEEGVALTSGFLSRDAQLEWEPWGVRERPDMTESADIALTEWVGLNPDIESIVMIYIPGISDEPVAGIEQGCASLGIQILEKIEIDMMTIDLSAAATRALSLNPDGITVDCMSEQAAIFCKEVFERGMTEGRRLLIGGYVISNEFYEIGEGFIEDTYYWEKADLTSEDPGWLAYVDAYKADHDGAAPYSWANWGYLDGVFAFKEAVEQLNITGLPSKLAEERLAIRDFLWNAQGIPSVFGGTFSYIDGEKQMDFMLFQMKDNQLVQVS